MSDAEDLSINWGPDSTQAADEPLVHVRADGDAWINSVAGERYFDGDETAVGVDERRGLLVFDPDCERTDRTLTIHHGDGGAGGELSCTSRTRQLLDLDALEETLRVPLVERDDGLLVADVASARDGDGPEPAQQDVAQGDAQLQPATVDSGDLVGADADLADDGDDLDGFEPDADETDDLLAEHHTNQPLVEEYLVDALARGEREFTSREIADAMSEDVGGRQVGHALSALMKAADAPFAVDQTDQTTDNGAMVWRVEPSVELAAKLGRDTSVDLESVLGEDVESVQALAEALDIDEGEARRRAMDAGVYSDLQDHVDRPGVERDA